MKATQNSAPNSPRVSFCPACGAQVQQPDARFCNHCGTPIAPTKKSPVSKPKKRAAKRTGSGKKALLAVLIVLAVLVAAAIVTIWVQRVFFPEGVLARMMPYMALLYVLLLPALAISLRTKLRRIDEQEAWEKQWEEAENKEDEKDEDSDD